jgi:predicted phage baseplate assembly protein
MGLPIPKLADKTFEEILKEARALIGRYTPGWTDHNLHDPGITFLELFAWIAEMQMYYADRLTDEHYRRFLEMAGFSQLGLQPARAAVSFGNVTADTTVPAHTQVVALIGTEQIPFATEEEIVLIPAGLKALKTISGPSVTDRTEANERNEISFSAFGEQPEAGAALHLGFDNPLPEKDVSLTIFLFDDDLPPAARHGDEMPQVAPSIEIAWEYFRGGSWSPLVVKDDGTSALTKSGRVVIEGPSAMDLLNGFFWIRCRSAKGRYEIAPVIDRILINTVTAIQIEAVVNEDLGAGEGFPGQKKTLKKPPVLEKSQAVEVSMGGGAWEAWQEVDDFENSGPLDRHYHIDAETSEISFGNGLNGCIPGTGDQIRVSYRTTLGSKGNIPGGRKFLITTSGFSGITVTNPKKAEGGKDPETIESAKARARRDLSVPYRAITAADFEEAAISTPGLRVVRAKAITNYHPLYPCVINFPNWVTVVVVPVSRETDSMPLPGQGFLDTVSRHLDKHHLVTTGVSVVGPKYVRISVGCTVKIRKRSSPSAVAAMVEEALVQFLDPLHGGPDRKGWPFGRSVFPSEIYQVVDAVEGVDYATDVSIIAEGEYQEDEGIIRIPAVALVCSGSHRIGILE